MSGSGDGLVDDVAGDQLQGLGQGGAVGAFAIAVEQPFGFAERPQKAKVALQAIRRSCNCGKLGNWPARFTSGKPSNFSGVCVTWAMASSSDSAGSERISTCEQFVSSSALVSLGRGRSLVGARIHDRANQMLQVELVVPEVLRQRFEQGAVGRRIGLPKIVGRIDQALAHQVGPDAVGLGAGEERIVRAGDPVGQEQQPIVLGRPVPASGRRAGAAS